MQKFIFNIIGMVVVGVGAILLSESLWFLPVWVLGWVIYETPNYLKK